MAEQLVYRETDRLAAEINTIKQQTARQLLTASIEIGERLTQAKNLVPHGEWEQWLADNVDYSQSTAQNLMKIYREYGSNQIGFGGQTALDIYKNMTYSQALELLALPAAQRDEFVEENDVEGMSTRELHQAIAEAKAEAEEAARRADKLTSDYCNANEKILNLTAKAELMQTERDAARQKAQKANDKIANLKSQIDELTKPRELTAEERAEIEKGVAAKYEAEIAQLSLTAAAEKETAERLKSEAAALEEKYKKQANGDLQKFQALFERFQRDLADLRELADKIGGETGGKLRQLINQLITA